MRVKHQLGSMSHWGWGNIARVDSRMPFLQSILCATVKPILLISGPGRRLTTSACYFTFHRIIWENNNKLVTVVKVFSLARDASHEDDLSKKLSYYFTNNNRWAGWLLNMSARGNLMLPRGPSVTCEAFAKPSGQHQVTEGRYIQHVSLT